VRGLAKYLSGIDPRTEIPPPGVLPYGGNRRRKPHIYTEDEIRRLLKGTRATNLARQIRSKTYATLFGLLATEIAVTMPNQNLKTCIGAFFFIVALIFVYARSIRCEFPKSNWWQTKRATKVAIPI